MGITELKVMMTTVHEHLENVEEKQDELKAIIHQMPSNGAIATHSNRMQTVKALFPLRNIEALNDLENKLIDKQYRADIVSILF